MTWTLRSTAQLLLLALLLGLAGGYASAAQDTASPAVTPNRWQSIITPAQLHARMQAEPDLIVIDARKPEEYAQGHIPGAISLPGDMWRTAQAEPGEGHSQYIFRKADGSADIERYERFLGQAGIRLDRPVVVYGNHAGKTDGSVPVMILQWLGHPDAAFLDGVGHEAWKQAGHAVSTQPRTLAATTFDAKPDGDFLWTLDEVQANLHQEDVVFYDTRSRAEHAGEDRRDNKYGGRIPGSVHCDYAVFLTEENTIRSPAAVKAELERRGLTPDKELVLYCQTATRVSLPYMLLRDLGYEQVGIYDASWHEYGNREDTVIEGKTEAK